VIKIIILISSIIFPLIVSSIEPPIPQKEVNWQLIPGSNIPGIKSFIDVNNTITFGDDEDNKFNLVNVLFSYNFPTQMMINGKEMIIQGIVKILLIECNSGLVAPMKDYYFVEKSPMIKTKPIGGLTYSEDVRRSGAFTIDRNTTLYNALCPTYI
jgi:hypothetical protein